MVILSMRDGYLVPPNKKKIESHPEEKSKTSHISNPKYKSGRVDSEEPTAILPNTRYVTKTEKVLYSSSREDFQHNQAKKYEPVKYFHYKGIPALNYTMELKKLVAEAENDVRKLKHERNASEPVNDVDQAVEYLNEAVKLLTARQSDNFGALSVMSGANASNNLWKEAAKKYRGAIV